MREYFVVVVEPPAAAYYLWVADPRESNVSRALRAISKPNCGSPHRGRVSFFARAKTILPGAKLGAQSAPAGPAPRMARVKETKESTPRMAQYPLRFAPRPLRSCGRSARGLRCSGAPYGFENTSALRPEVVCSHPRRSEPSTAAKPEWCASPCLSPRRVVQRQASWRAPGRSEARREPRAVCAAKRPGVFLFGDFLLDKQEKVTQGAGAEPPAISFLSSAKPTQQIVRWVTAKTA